MNIVWFILPVLYITFSIPWGLFFKLWEGGGCSYVLRPQTVPIYATLWWNISMDSGRGRQKMNSVPLRSAQVYHGLHWEGFRSCRVRRTDCLNYGTAVVWNCIWDTWSSSSQPVSHRVAGWPHRRPDKTGGEYNYTYPCVRSHSTWVSAGNWEDFSEAKFALLDSRPYGIA
jgi:hypothetical protein